MLLLGPPHLDGFATQETSVSVPTFVVGAGDCVSTMPSNSLRKHPHVLSLSRCAAAVRPTRSAWCDLPEEGRRALTEACRLGFERRCESRYDLSTRERLQEEER